MTANTVHDRLRLARATLTPTQVLSVLLAVAALGFVLVLFQDPTAHEAMHNFRHAAGVVCH
ncbi:CbtB domain-containing protein [Halorubrum halophilum]|uniref:CbtB domain-containing protein n=1 Tax=Halorubrum halophilum TaxID=413816 RepID=UPI000678DBEE|nr:CbtB domain-containing protein [Halorubrum halophilum]